MSLKEKLYHYRATVINVVDGDTIDVDIDLGFGITKRERIRLYGVNAWEMRGEERFKGIQAKQFTTHLLLEQRVTLQTFYRKDPNDDATGKYGRLLAKIEIHGQDFGELLIEDGFARPATY